MNPKYYRRSANKFGREKGNKAASCWSRKQTAKELARVAKLVTCY
jgi:hypothetical protein